MSGGPAGAVPAYDLRLPPLRNGAARGTRPACPGYGWPAPRPSRRAGSPAGVLSRFPAAACRVRAVGPKSVIHHFGVKALLALI